MGRFWTLSISWTIDFVREWSCAFSLWFIAQLSTDEPHPSYFHSVAFCTAVETLVSNYLMDIVTIPPSGGFCRLFSINTTLASSFAACFVNPHTFNLRPSTLLKLLAILMKFLFRSVSPLFPQNCSSVEHSIFLFLLLIYNMLPFKSKINNSVLT